MALADPEFHKPKNIDMLIGVDLFWDLLCPESSQYPYLHKTKLGYVVSGRIPRFGQTKKSTICNFAASCSDIHQQLKQFWEIEECPKQEVMSREEKACEQNFIETTERDAKGRFIVTIPLKGSLSSLGESEEQARNRFLSLERKLQRNEELRSKYTDFMQQYERLGHMTKVTEEHQPPHTYYLPHHGVLKEESLTTKLRVVFDGSAASATGVSFNDLQAVGPTIQPELWSIVLRFRMYPFVVGADISMMYRQVLVNPEQRALQRILWRYSPSETLQTFELNTITYGLASSSFLAIRCLFQLAAENETSHPRVTEIIRKCMYVDDLLYGTHTMQEAVQIREDISRILATGGFPLRKWISNAPKIIEDSSTSDNDIPCHVIKLGENEAVKTLGLSWLSTSDNLIYDVSDKLKHENCSKRTILSVIARIYDPLGLLGPCIIIAKIILQRLWMEKTTWDDPLPPEIYHDWKGFANNLTAVKRLEISRQACCASPNTVEIHAFSDASTVAYGAAVYIRSIDTSGKIFSRLLCAKSKVSPLKPMTIPRLELCAAQLSARLVEKVKHSLDVRIDSEQYWCDSTIVLSWLKLEPHRLKTFVSNRVFEVQSLSKPANWHHVSTHENPADFLSRGANLADLQNSSLWWEGPAWLSSSHFTLSNIDDTIHDLPEMKMENQTTAFSQTSDPLIIFENYSNLNKLERTIAYCLRFISNCKKPKAERQYKHLAFEEIHNAMIYLVKVSQLQSFHEDIRHLAKYHEVTSKSKLSNLHPFIHKDGTLRVDGRISQSNCTFDRKHPMILSSKHHLTKLIFIREHQRLLHVGPQTLLSCIRDKYWPISGRNLARKTVRDCLKCFKANPKEITTLMGNLPYDRVNPAPAFNVTGVDYAGPFLIKDKKGRGGKASKCYVALFVCFVTRAVHLELVSDLTSDCFILALRRFSSRWGLPRKIYSDNGTNFVGARSQLNELGKFFREKENSLNDIFVREHFNWHLIPAYSPHFGGIWEAGVKSTKYHLKRVLNNASLTFEEFYNLLAQIGAILNSRPLTPLSSHPSDLQPLTPSHFLVGRALTSVPDPDVTHIPESHLSRYQRIQQLQQHFGLVGRENISPSYNVESNGKIIKDPLS